MLHVCKVEFKPGTKEELLPDYSPDFPYVATRCQFCDGENAPWHWHQAAELFYIEKGTLEYFTPSGHQLFREGSAGFINSNVPHMTVGHDSQTEKCQLLHLFDPTFISGIPTSRIEKKYIQPLTSASQVEMLYLDPEDPVHAEIIQLIHASFRPDAEDAGYELRIRAALSEIWLRLLDISAPLLTQKNRESKNSQVLKQMLIYIQEHYSEKLTVKDIADSAFVSERSCFALFKKYLHATPQEYVNSYRLRVACRMLAESDKPVTEVALTCGMPSASYFSQQFKNKMGLTPLEYRKTNHR